MTLTLVLTLLLTAPLAAASAPDGAVPRAEAPDPGLGIRTAAARCTADCGGSVLSCSGTTCSAEDRDCSVGRRGQVQCGGGPVQVCMPACPATCTDGEERYVPTGICCEELPSEQYRFQKCVNGGWETQNSVCGPSTKCTLGFPS